MKQVIILAAVPAMISGLLLATGCSDSSDRSPDVEPPLPPVVSLAATGIYDGTLVTDNDDIALMRVLVARDGTTSINLQTDDSGRANRILWGRSDGSDSELTFSGDDTASGDSVSLDLAVAGDDMSGQLALADLKGEFQLRRHAGSDSTGEIAALAGSYGRTDANGTLLQLQIAADGSVTVSGACDGSGSVTSPDEQVNIYRLQSDASCLDIDSLVTVEELAGSGGVLAVSGVSGSAGYSADFYRQ